MCLLVYWFFPCPIHVSGKKKSTKINFFGPETVRWGRVLPREGGGVVEKPLPSLENQGEQCLSPEYLGISLGCRPRKQKNIYHHRPESKKRNSSEGHSCSIQAYGKYELLKKQQNHIYHSSDSLACKGHFREEGRYGGGRYFHVLCVRDPGVATRLPGTMPEVLGFPLNLWPGSAPIAPPNPENFKDTKKWLKSDFWGSGQSDSKVS